MQYYYSAHIPVPFDRAVERATEELKREGFGVLTDIDVQATLKKKLGVDFRRYRILGACNPPFAHKALLAEDKVGVMLPCNLIVQEAPDGRVEISTINPLAAMQAVGNPALNDIAREVSTRLEAVISRLGA